MKPLSDEYLRLLRTSPSDQELSEYWYRQHHGKPVKGPTGDVRRLMDLAQSLRMAARVITGEVDETRKSRE